MTLRATGKRIGDVAAILAVLVAGLAAWNPNLPLRRRGYIFVSPRGSNWNSGADRAHAVRSLQYAVDLARPGDTVFLLPGVYHERVRIRRGGEPGRPVTIKALEPGTVLITGEADPSVIKGLRWRDEGRGVFSAATAWPIYFVKCDGKALLHLKWHGAKAIHGFAAREGAWGVWYWKAGRLYVALPGGRSPAGRRLAFNDRVPPPGEWGGLMAANLWIEADHLRIEGLRLEFGVGAGIRLWRASNVEIADCLFTGAYAGVKATRPLAPITGLRIEHCLYHNYPEREWRRAWLTKQETYALSGTGFCASDAADTVIRNNLIVHATDGMVVTTRNLPRPGRVEVSGNLIAWCTDDAIEFDGFARGIAFHHNLVYDCHESLGISPVLAGPVTIRRNLFLHPAGGINGAQVKLLSPWLDEPPPLNGPIRNVRIRENTFVGNWLCWYGNCPVEDVRVERNLFAVRRTMTPPWPEGVVEVGNIYLEPPGEDAPNPAMHSRWFAPSEEVPADGPGAGAVPPGRRWTMARPGPRWLDWKGLPATAPLLDVISPEIFAP